MSTSRDESDTPLLWRLTADQRRQIYEDEKRRIEQSAPLFSRRTKILAVTYLVGCVLQYFGIPWSLIEFYRTRQWRYQPDPDFVKSLGEATVQLIMPFLTVYAFVAMVALPVGLVFGVICWISDLLRWLKNLFNRDKE